MVLWPIRARVLFELFYKALFMTFPYNVKFWMIILAPSSPSRDVTMHRVLQNFYDKTNSEEPLMAWQKNGAKFPHSPILHYAYSPLLEENNSANNRLPLGLFALFSRSWIFFFKSLLKPLKNRRLLIKNCA